MGFKIKDLGVLAYAHGFTYWYYRTEDDSEAVLADDYFAEARDTLRIGDRITGATSDRRAIDLTVVRNDSRGVAVEALALSTALQSA